MKSNVIEKAKARDFLIKYQSLDKRYTDDKEGVLSFMHRVGCIQYDPLNVVGRNADLVLQSRIKDYKPEILSELLYTHRALIDGWDKMMAIYKSGDWADMRRIREAHTEATLRTMKKRDVLGALEVTDRVKEILNVEGPKLAREISIGKAKRGSWGHGKLSSVALDYLYTSGKLGIHSKQNTQKVYDIIENLLSEEILCDCDRFNSDKEFYKWYVKRRIGSIGLLWNKSGGGWLGHYLSDKKLRTSIIEELVSNGDIKPIYIEGIKDAFYINSDDITLLEDDTKIQDNVRFIAPLDNLIWDRSMIKEIFDFSYTWEVYVPRAKRKYGYYVLPVLYKDRFIARFEPDKHRGNDVLSIKNWWWEEGIDITEDIQTSIINELNGFAKYLGADSIDVNISRLLMV